MKKKILSVLLLGLIVLTCGCSNKKSDGLKVLTTIYPIEFLTEQIYQDGVVFSLYPDGASTSNYTLTPKQIKQYSKNDIFIYNGLSNEQEIAKDVINSNKKLYIIDVAYGLKYENGIEELWLSPNYYLMLAKTITDNLKEFVSSKYAKEELENRYNELAEKLSIMDAELRTVAKSANEINKGTIVASSNMFKYLKNYGFDVISLEDVTNSKTIINDFKNNTYTTLFTLTRDADNELVKELEQNGAKIITVNSMETLTKEEKENNDTYFTIMNEYMENIKNATIGN